MNDVGSFHQLSSAMNPHTPGRELQELCQHPNPWLAYIALQNVKVPQSVKLATLERLAVLSDDSHALYCVQKNIVSDVFTDPEIIRMLITHHPHDAELKRRAVDNTATPDDVFNAFIYDDNSWVRAAVANSTRTNPDALLILMADDCEIVRRRAESNLRRRGYTPK